MAAYDCERCLQAATCLDTYRGEALCAWCCCPYCAEPGSPQECSYCPQFVSSTIPVGYVPPVEVSS